MKGAKLNEIKCNLNLANYMHVKNHQGSIIKHFHICRFMRIAQSISRMSSFFKRLPNRIMASNQKGKRSAPCFVTQRRSSWKGRLSRSSFVLRFGLQMVHQNWPMLVSNWPLHELYSTFSNEPMGRDFQSSKNQIFRKARSNSQVHKFYKKMVSPMLGVEPCFYRFSEKILNFKQAQSEPSMWRHLRGCYFDFWKIKKWEFCGWDTSAGAPPHGGLLLLKALLDSKNGAKWDS